MLVLCALLAVLVLSSFVVAYHGSSRRASYIQSDEFIISSASSYGGSYGMPHMSARYRAMPMQYFYDESYPRYVTNRRSGRVFYTMSERYRLDDGRRVLYQPFPAACPYPLVAC